jgi:hypothetical protein
MSRSKNRDGPLAPIDVLPEGRDARSLGPSDGHGTAERASADVADARQSDSGIDPNRIVSATEAGLGGGLDQAKEAQFGITDEELEIMRRQPHRITRNPFR